MMKNLSSIDLATVTGGKGDSWEQVMGDTGTYVGSAAGAALGSYIGGPRGGFAGGMAGNAIGGLAGRGIGRAIDSYESPRPVDEGRAWSHGRGPGSLNRGAGGVF